VSKVSTLERGEYIFSFIPLSCGHGIEGRSNRHLIHVGLLGIPKSLLLLFSTLHQFFSLEVGFKIAITLNLEGAIYHFDMLMDNP
jgi:hypothetical protein